MSSDRQPLVFEPPVRFVLERVLSLTRRTNRLEPPVRFVSERLIGLQVKAVDRYVPDRLLLFYMKLLDNHVPPKAIDVVIDELDKHLPPKVRSSLIAVADEYLPDSAASSRKVSAVIAGVGKYVPDRVIPQESMDNWSKLKLRFHIPTLLSRGQADSRKDQ
jgi:hypothetical protein